MRSPVSTTSLVPPVDGSMTFKTYLAGLKAGPDKKGDFIRIARSDNVMPDPSSWQALRAYVSARHNNENLLEGAVIVWRAYVAALSPHGKR